MENLKCRKCGTPTKHRIMANNGGLCSQCNVAANEDFEQAFWEWRVKFGYDEAPYLMAMEAYLNSLSSERGGRKRFDFLAKTH